MGRVAWLCLLLAGCAGRLRPTDRWTALESAHFHVLTDADPALVARAVPRAETVLAGIAARVRPGRPLPARVDVLWLRAPDAVAELGVTGARGYYLPQRPPLLVIAGEPDRAVERALIHELAHVFFVDAAPAAPPWLAEGLAAFWETLDLDAGTVGAAAPVPLHLYSVAELLRADWDAFHGTQLAGRLYDCARAFVALLLADPALAPRFDAYLADGARAWNAHFGDVTDLQARFDRAWSTPPRPLPLPPWRGPVATRRESPSVVERWLARARVVSP